MDCVDKPHHDVAQRSLDVLAVQLNRIAIGIHENRFAEACAQIIDRSDNLSRLSPMLIQKAAEQQARAPQSWMRYGRSNVSDYPRDVHPMMFRLFTITQRRLRVKVWVVTMPSPVVVAMEKFA